VYQFHFVQYGTVHTTTEGEYVFFAIEESTKVTHFRNANEFVSLLLKHCHIFSRYQTNLACGIHTPQEFSWAWCRIF